MTFTDELDRPAPMSPMQTVCVLLSEHVENFAMEWSPDGGGMIWNDLTSLIGRGIANQNDLRRIRRLAHRGELPKRLPRA